MVRAAKLANAQEFIEALPEGPGTQPEGGMSENEMRLEGENSHASQIFEAHDGRFRAGFLLDHLDFGMAK